MHSRCRRSLRAGDAIVSLMLKSYKRPHTNSMAASNSLTRTSRDRFPCDREQLMINCELAISTSNHAIFFSTCMSDNVCMDGIRRELRRTWRSREARQKREAMLHGHRSTRKRAGLRRASSWFRPGRRIDCHPQACRTWGRTCVGPLAPRPSLRRRRAAAAAVPQTQRWTRRPRGAERECCCRGASPRMMQKRAEGAETRAAASAEAGQQQEQQLRRREQTE